MSNSAIFAMDIGAILNDFGGNNMTAEVTFFAGDSAPSGWLPANGAALSRTAYAALFAILGTAYGAGDGATTFNLPDLRGEFVRGWDNGRGVDTGRQLGSAQADDFKSHTHLTPHANQSGSGVGYIGGMDPVYQAVDATSASGGTETRPRNVAMLAIIKY